MSSDTIMHITDKDQHHQLDIGSVFAEKYKLIDFFRGLAPTWNWNLSFYGSLFLNPIFPGQESDTSIELRIKQVLGINSAFVCSYLRMCQKTFINPFFFFIIVVLIHLYVRPDSTVCKFEELTRVVSKCFVQTTQREDFDKLELCFHNL